MAHTLKEVSKLLLQGQVGVIPTDTTYGLVACAADQKAVTQLYELKGREKKPGPIIAASVDQLVELGVPARYIKPIAHYWPGAISIVIPCGPDLTYLHQGLYSLALRIPDDPQLVEFLEATGPLLTTSANHAGEPPATNIQEAQNYFGDSVGFYVDGGDYAGKQPSTVIRVVDDAVEVLRAGAVKINEYGEITE